MDDSGNYVIVWDSVGPSVAGHLTAGRRFRADGSAIDTQQFPINLQNAAASTRPSIAMDADGDFVVTWQAEIPFNGYEVYAQRFSKNGDAVGPLIPVNSQSPTGTQWTPDVAMDALGNFVVTWNSVNGTANVVMARWFSAAGVGEAEFLVTTPPIAIYAHTLTHPRVAMNSTGEFAILWSNYERFIGVSIPGAAPPNSWSIVGQRYDDLRRPIGGNFSVSNSLNGEQLQPEVAMDEDGNWLVVWSDHDTSGGRGYSARRFDKWGNLLGDEFKVANLQSATPTDATVGLVPDGEFVISWMVPDGSGDATISTQRFTLQAPTVLNMSPGPNRNSIIVGFSQEMAADGAGSVLTAANWALRLPDGRYVVQDDPNSPGPEPLTTTEQFGDISLAFNAATHQWEATLPLSFTMPAGTYRLTARSSLQDAAGRRLDGDGDGIPSENYTFEFAFLAGDYSWDDQVDSDDYGVWRSSFGLNGQGLRADGNGDGVVDAADYVIWRKNLGATTGLAHAAFIASDTTLGVHGADVDEVGKVASGSGIGDSLGTISVINLDGVRTSKIASVGQTNGQLLQRSFDGQFFDLALEPASQSAQLRSRKLAERLPVFREMDFDDLLLALANDHVMSRSDNTLVDRENGLRTTKDRGGPIERFDLAFVNMGEEIVDMTFRQ
jgi:hypothetical protein